MDKNFWDPIQLNSDYFSESAVWKKFSPSMGADFVSLKSEIFSAGALVAGLDFKLNSFNFTQNLGTVSYKQLSGAEIDYSMEVMGDTIYERNFLNPDTLFVGDELPQWHIADANIDRKLLRMSYNLHDFYTTAEVAYREAGGNLSHFLPQDNITLQSVTYQDFKNNGNVFTVTSPFGNVETVSLQLAVGSSTLLPDCGHPAAATLSNSTTGQTITLCVDMLKSNDFALAVYGIAFHTDCTIFTEDSCIGYSFKEFNSFSLTGNIFWKNRINYKIKNLCSHNH